jgi:cystathionine beta-lyase/cystathionine gamma-synthase
VSKVSHPETTVLHPKSVELPPGNMPVVKPIYQSVKFHVSPDVPMSEQFVYSRISNPGLRRLEIMLADLQKKEDCLVLGSGLSAVSGTLLGLLQAGDHMISAVEIYKPARLIIRDILPRYGITSTLISLKDLSVLKEQIIPGKTKLLYFESPSNPHCQLSDIDGLIKFCEENKILLVMDGTFGGLHQHTNSGIDVMIQSLTKYANGHGDVTAGSIATSKILLQKIRQITNFLGAALDPHAGFLIERGLKTYFMRYERHTKNAMEVAQYLRTHEKIKRVFYPEGPLAQKQMPQSGGVLSFELDPSAGTALEFCHRCELFQFTASLGSPETLVSPTLNFFGDDLSEDLQREMGINQFTVRLAVGLEHPEDIKAELDRMLLAHVGR